MKEEPKETPHYLIDDASYLQCSICGRKSWGGEEINSVCNILQPNWKRCDGILEGKKNLISMKGQL